jgi:selenocysteine-specific elongation factor
MSKEELRAAFKIDPRLFSGLIASLNDVVMEREIIRLKSFSTVLSQAEETLKTKIFDLLQKNEFQPPSKEELSQSLKLEQKHLSDILKLMVKEGSLIRISDSMYLASSAYNKMIAALKNFYGRKPEMTVAEFRDLLGTTRKYALPILEYLDSNKTTLRVGDVRKLLLKS